MEEKKKTFILLCCVWRH